MSTATILAVNMKLSMDCARHGGRYNVYKIALVGAVVMRTATL